MMRKYTILAAALLFAAVSCVKNNLMEYKGVGTLSMDMSISQQTKAMSQDDLLASAVVKIYKADFSGLVRSYNYSEIPSPFYLAADSYRVDVVAGEAVAANPSAASWENKSYKGSKEFTITAGNVTNVEVVAKVNNAITQVTFDQTVAENFNEGYSLTIGLDAEKQLVYDASKSGAEGYFIVAGIDEPSFTWTFTGVLAKDGSSFTKSGEIKDVLPGKIYKMSPMYTIKDGDLVFSLLVDYTTDIVDDVIIFDPVSTGLSMTPGYEVWATHTTVYADVDATENEGKTVQFSYSANGTDWTYVDAVNHAEGAWKAELTGLAPATQYTYNLVLDGEAVGEPLTFTTETARKIPNGSFEYCSLVAGESYYKFYDPSCSDPDSQTMFWGSGNGEGSEGVNGSASMGITITYIDTDNKKDGKQSVKAQTSSMVGMLAAGNIFTGQFMGLVGTSGGKVNFGRPWTTRPSALKLYCKYNTGKMNIVNNNNLGVSTSDYDRAQIKVAIGTWNYKTYGGTKDSPVHVNTTDESTFVDFYTDPSTIANGDLIIYNDGYSINKGAKVTANTTEWIEYTIPLDYRQLTTYPTHIVISCAASQFGDYFTGYDQSALWVDAVELIY